MAIRDVRYSPDNPYARRENQQWDMAGLARQDGDTKAAEEHTKKAREFAELARAWEGR